MDTVFELQSFRCRGSSHELVGEAAREEGRVSFCLAVDRETYQAIRRCVDPKDGRRYRLSRRCKWDPFRQQYFSSVTRIGRHKRRLFYFPCSTGYRDALDRLHDISFTPRSKPTRSIRRLLRMAAHICVLGFFLVVCMLSLYYFHSSDRAVIPHNRIVSAAQQPVPAANEELCLRQRNEVASIPEVKEESLPPGDVPVDAGPSDAKVPATGVVVNSLPEGYVALTFDDGPSPYTREIVDILCEHQVRATFFFIGLHALKYPEAVKYAHDREMVVGNHSWSHSSLNGKGPAELRNEIMKTNDYLSSITGVPVTVLRPPFGHVNDRLISFIADEQMKIVLWNRDPRDWSVSDANDITDYIYNTEVSGGIYVLHENGLTVRALPEIIRYLKENEVRFAVLR